MLLRSYLIWRLENGEETFFGFWQPARVDFFSGLAG
jgi:hypothetical protein